MLCSFQQVILLTSKQQAQYYSLRNLLICLYSVADVMSSFAQLSSDFCTKFSLLRHIICTLYIALYSNVFPNFVCFILKLLENSFIMILYTMLLYVMLLYIMLLYFKLLYFMLLYCVLLFVMILYAMLLYIMLLYFKLLYFILLYCVLLFVMILYIMLLYIMLLYIMLL
jgi:hypothetical protein